MNSQLFGNAMWLINDVWIAIPVQCVRKLIPILLMWLSDIHETGNHNEVIIFSSMQLFCWCMLEKGCICIRYIHYWFFFTIIWCDWKWTIPEIKEYGYVFPDWIMQVDPEVSRRLVNYLTCLCQNMFGELVLMRWFIHLSVVNLIFGD